MSGRFALRRARSAQEHFRLLLLGAVLRILELHDVKARAALREAYPFVDQYGLECADLARQKQVPGAAQWLKAVSDMALDRPDFPFNRLDRAKLGPLAPVLLATIMMVEEDPALALLIEPDGGFPTLGGLMALWRNDGNGDRALAVRDTVFELIAAGIVEAVNPDAMRSEWRIRTPAPVLDVLSGSVVRCEAAAWLPHAALPKPPEWIAPDRGMVTPKRLAELIKADPVRLLIVRGPGHNGRRLLIEAAARDAGMNLLRCTSTALSDAGLWQTLGAVAHLSNAMILIELSPAPGETVTLPEHRLFAGPVAVVIGRQGAVRPAAEMPMLTIEMGLPDAAARKRQWRKYGLGAIAADLDEFALTLGNIARAAASARALADLGKQPVAVTAGHVRAAARDLRDARLDALATPVRIEAELEPLFLGGQDRAEFEALKLRARHREAMGGGRGVRALFVGPSGTGKTLTAKHVAKDLNKDLFRIDLSATVSKYIGETEKALEAALSAAEELDIVLLLDEGDALMARRTDVGSANDRYANMETNFLLQRIENFDGIILITTNDGERIDQAFSRRMDVVMPFRAPDEARRLEILLAQLGKHEASSRLLNDIACRCQLNGGQLRNIAQHARLLAHDKNRPTNDAALRAAVEREYRKKGEVPPLKPLLAAVS